MIHMHVLILTWLYYLVENTFLSGFYTQPNINEKHPKQPSGQLKQERNQQPVVVTYYSLQ